MKKPTIKKLKKGNLIKDFLGYGYEINITGNRDYRSPDIDIFTGVNYKDELSIMIPKTERCYKFSHIVEEKGFLRMVFK